MKQTKEELLKKLVPELDELNEKLNRLKDYILKDSEFSKLSAQKQDLLLTQAQAMDRYKDVLSKRINLIRNEH